MGLGTSALMFFSLQILEEVGRTCFPPVSCHVSRCTTDAPQGGKARRVGGPPALARQKAMREHDQREVLMQPIPMPALVMV